MQLQKRLYEPRVVPRINDRVPFVDDLMPLRAGSGFRDLVFHPDWELGVWIWGFGVWGLEFGVWGFW